MSLKSILASVAKISDPKKAQHAGRFFKSFKGGYGEGDQFCGLTNPQARLIARENKGLPLQQAEQLLQSRVHQERFIALVILIEKFKKKEHRKQIYQIYIRNLSFVNNWDLVDLSAPHIVGQYLLDNPEQKKALYHWVQSQKIFQRRVSILATFAFIRAQQYQDTLQMAEILLRDNHDLIHKSVGWMLREVGKRQISILQNFIKKHYVRIPRTCLRYAIEKFPESQRKRYLKGDFSE